MSTERIDAAMLSRMFLAGAANLAAHKEYINELNVFPVPDGDTGTNMTMTVTSAASEVSALERPTFETLSKAMSSGSLRGARGNSGVILSQLLRGFSKTIASVEHIDAPVVAESFKRAVETAYKAVMKPKEGTILTVARCVAERAESLVGETDDLVVFGEEIIKTAEETLDKTPDLLPVLKEAGVVDSGGQGLLEFLRGCYDVVLGKKIDYSAIETGSLGAGIVKISEETKAEITFGYCTEFIIVLDETLGDDEIREFKTYLNGMGDSIVFVPDDDFVKVHIHTNNPGSVLQKALEKGSLSKIKIDNMREEHQEKLFKDSLKLAAEQKALEEKEKSEEEISSEHKEVGFVAVCAGAGLESILKDLGVDVVISGGQTMNPSTDDILKAVEKVDADTVYILPNNSNIILAANQAAELAPDKDVVVIPTKTVPQGISAMINYLPDLSAQENTECMIESINEIKTAEVTYAVRDTTIDGVSVSENDYMAIGDGKILGAGKDIDEVVLDMLEKIIDEDSEILTIYYGEDVDEEAAGHIRTLAEERYEDIDIEIYEGGQPVYYYIISVE